MPDARPQTSSRPIALAVWLIIAGVIGWWAAFQLTLEKLHALANPGSSASCDFSILVQCTANLESWQGSVFGFPNPLIGVTCWVAPIVVGVAILSGARFSRWFWLLFELGMTFAFVFVVWLISQSIFVLGTLCPWCMLVWTVTIPLFWIVTVRNLAEGVYGEGAAQRFGSAVRGWVIPIVLISYAVVALVAQLGLNWISYL